MPVIPAELLEWQVFYVELMRRLGIEPEHYKPLLDTQHKWDSKIESLEKTLSNVKASLRRKQIALRNLDSLHERDGYDSADYFQKRTCFLQEVNSLDDQLKNTQQRIEDLRNRKTQKAEFAKEVSGTAPFKALSHKIMNLSFSGKQRLLRGLLDGPVVLGHSALIPHVGSDPEDEMVKILEGTEMTVCNNYSILYYLFPE